MSGSMDDKRKALETPGYRQDPRPPIEQLRQVARWVAGLGILVAIVGIVGAAILATTTRSGFGDSTHPYVGGGVLLAALGLSVGSFLLLVARWAQAWAVGR